MMENFGDAPFFPGPVPAATIACMATIAAEVRRRVDAPLGVNVLRNDGCAAVAIAAAVGASFIRVNVLCGARLTDQGIVHGVAHDLLRLRASLGAQRVAILADVDVKHSAPLGDYPLADEVRDAIERGGADAVIVSGSGTGRPTDREQLRVVREAAGGPGNGAPVFVGSGVTPENAARYAESADGLIVGSSLKRGGLVSEAVDPGRVQQLLARVGAPEGSRR
jgi:membrane complex biogenesis BtpA family protein